MDSLKRDGVIAASDWKLYMCDQENGHDFLHSWGPEGAALAELEKEAGRGRDVWLIAPSGEKILPDAAPQDCEEVRRELGNLQGMRKRWFRIEDKLRAQLEAEKQGAAAMRDKLEDIARGPLQGPGDFSVYAQEVAKQALSSDAGRDYVPAENKGKDAIIALPVKRFEPGFGHPADGHGPTPKMVETLMGNFVDYLDYLTVCERLRKAEEELEQYKRDGWKLVPVEPDFRMREVASQKCNIHHVHAENVYRAMVDAVPEG